MTDAIIASPGSATRQLLHAVRRLLIRSAIMRRTAGPGEAQSQARPLAPGVGSVSFGDLNRVTPISTQFGFDRGTPIDRRYIEAFLGRHAGDITGRVLEVGGDEYCRRFGGSRITRQDVLSLSAENPRATIVGDLSRAQTLPEAAFDALVLTQTLQFVFDVRAAVVEMHRALKPGGVALLTLPGVSQIERGAPAQSWCWSFTPRSAFQLFTELFGGGNVAVESHGNVYAAMAFLYGLAIEDVDASALDVNDPLYPVIVTVRAHKASTKDDGDPETHPPSVR